MVFAESKTHVFQRFWLWIFNALFVTWQSYLKNPRKMKKSITFGEKLYFFL